MIVSVIGVNLVRFKAVFQVERGGLIRRFEL